MDLTVSYQYNKLDVINFVLDSYSFEKVRCSLILILNSSLFVVGIVSLFFNQIPMGIFLILFAIVIFPILLYLTYITARNSLKMITSVICTLKDEGLDFISNLGESLVPFKDIYEVKVTEELIFVYISKVNVLIIPKRAFTSREKAIDFAAALIDRCNKAKNN